jgi:hypothetical protein
MSDKTKIPPNQKNKPTPTTKPKTTTATTARPNHSQTQSHQNKINQIPTPSDIKQSTLKSYVHAESVMKENPRHKQQNTTHIKAR